MPEPNETIVLKLTRAQQIALIEVLLAYMNSDLPAEYLLAIDGAPVQRITVKELMRLVAVPAHCEVA